MKIKIVLPIIIIIILFTIVSIFTFGITTSTLSSVNPNPDTYSTSGPTPPEIPEENQLTANTLQTLSTQSNSRILNVPTYDWYHGCGPTAIGMLLGYYDLKYGTNYLNGNPENQAEIKYAICSNEHYNDYSEPIDTGQPSPLADVSETGVPHADNCIADFLGTSVSKDYLYYGWSYTAKIDDSIEQYTSYTGKKLQAQYYDQFTLTDLKNEINDNRPFIVYMNADGIGSSDHFATCVGYNYDNLIIHTTWANNPTIETPLLDDTEQFGITGVILTTNPDGEGQLSTPGFEILIFIISLITITIYIGVKRR